MGEQNNSGQQAHPRGILSTDKLQVTTYSSPVTVTKLPQASRFTPRQGIHPRRIIPTVPVGAAVADNVPSSSCRLEMPQATRAAGIRAAPLAATDNLVLVRNVELGSAADNNTASNVGEPSVAINGDVAFYTGNWYAAVSTDGGATFQYVDPATAFPDPPGLQFCCDQVVHYIPSIDTFVWLLQYTEDTNGENIQRLAFAKTADVELGNWQTFDISSQGLGLPNTFLDFPDIAVGANMLYVTTNGFVGQNWTATILVRLPLLGIDSGNITGDFTVSSTNFNFRVAQNCDTRAFWASHEDTSTLRIFSWDENAAQPTSQDVSVASWSADSYESITPGGGRWLDRADPRVLGATKAGNDLWFAWGAGIGGTNNRPRPYIQLARIDATNLSLSANFNIWDSAFAAAYPALATNSNNEVGISFMIGGGGRFPTHVVGILTGTTRNVITAEGVRTPFDNQWGDYLTVRQNHPNTELFAATGFTLQAQTGGGFSDASPQFIIFGRSSDV